MKQAGSRGKKPRLRVAQEEDTLGTSRAKGQNTALSSPPPPQKPLGIISWLLLLVARAKESLWSFRLGWDRILSLEHEAPA